MRLFVTELQFMHFGCNILCKAIATMMLLILSTNISANSVVSGGNYFFLTLIILSVSYSFVAVTGLAMNPARDLAPRIAHTILPIKHKGSSNWNYAIVPVVGLTIGAIIVALIGNFTASFPVIP